jgi:ABC-type branched-subunit amino acid transport system substrate-binding protein
MRKSMVVAAASLTLLAACSSSKKATTTPTTGGAPVTTAGGSPTTAGGTTPTTASGAAVPTTAPNVPPLTGNTTTGVSATAIHFGSIEYKANYAGADDGFNARIKRENDAGGVFGRKLVLDTVIDDGQVADTDLTAAKTLVQQDNVFAVAPVMTAAFGGASYLNDAKVPFFGWSIEPRWCGLNWGFGFEGNDCDLTKTPNSGDFVQAEQKLFPDGTAKGKTIVVVAEDNDSARVALASFQSVWEHDGAKVVLNDSSIPSPPAVVGDYTPFAQKIMTANNGQPPDLVETVTSFLDTLQLYKKLIQLGYKGIVQGFTDYDPRIRGTSKGIVTEIQFAPFEDAASVPAVQQMVTDLDAYKPGIARSLPVASGYWIADFLIQALKKVGPNLSREALYNAINSGFTYDNHGGVAPVQWPIGHTFLQAGLVFVQDEGSAYVERIPLTVPPLIPNPLFKG